MEEKDQSTQLTEEEKYKAAKKRVEELKGYYSHLISYFAVNTVLILIWFFTGAGYPWFLWVLGWWGFGLFWHTMGVFVFNRTGSTWEKRKIKEVMDEMDKGERLAGKGYFGLAISS